MEVDVASSQSYMYCNFGVSAVGGGKLVGKGSKGDADVVPGRTYIRRAPVGDDGPVCKKADCE